MSQAQIDVILNRVDRLERFVGFLAETVVDMLEDQFGPLAADITEPAFADDVPQEEIGRMRTRYVRLARLGRNRARLKAL